MGSGERRAMVSVSALHGSPRSVWAVAREDAGLCGRLSLQFDPLNLTSGVALEVDGDDSDGEWRAWWNRGPGPLRLTSRRWDVWGS